MGKSYTAKVTEDDSICSPLEALYTNEFGRAAVGMCRRVSYGDGSGQMG